MGEKKENELVIVINALIIKDNKLLLVKKRNYWILPGGKINDRENDYECLRREIEEELSGTKIDITRIYKSFYDYVHKTPNSKKYLHSRVYFASILGELYGPSKEISDLTFVDKSIKMRDNFNISFLTSKVIDNLVLDGYLQ